MKDYIVDVLIDCSNLLNVLIGSAPNIFSAIKFSPIESNRILMYEDADGKTRVDTNFGLFLILDEATGEYSVNTVQPDFFSLLVPCKTDGIYQEWKNFDMLDTNRMQVTRELTTIIYTFFAVLIYVDSMELISNA